jgi:DNA (cytosine-5)-methyltransferase 1
MENVAGLSSMKNGLGNLVKEELFKLFNKIGYNVSSKVLLSADYGVPQLRKRIFFVGIQKDYNYYFNFPKPTHFVKNTLFSSKDNIYLTVNDAISDLPKINCNESSEEYSSKPQNSYQAKLRKNSKTVFNHKAPKHSDIVLEQIKNIPQGGNHGDLPEILKLKKGYPNIYGKLDENKPADTITGNCGCASTPGKFIHPTSNRVLTVREASRLQSFPDYVKFFGSVNEQYKQVRNSVPPLMTKSVAEEVKNSLLKCIS